MKGDSILAKIGRGFGSVFARIAESKVWKTIVNSGVLKFIRKWGPTILAKSARFGGRLLSIVGWGTLLLDVKDVAEVSACVGLAFEHKGDASKMPSFCDGDATKAIVKWSLEKAGISVTGASAE